MAEVTLSEHEAWLQLRGGRAPGWRLAGGRQCALGHGGLQWPVRTAELAEPHLVQARALRVLAAVLLRTPELPSPGLPASRSERALGRGS